MNIILTGESRFICSNICDYFIFKGYKITCLDNFSIGFRHNVQYLIDRPPFALIEQNVQDLQTCKKVVEIKDYILHQTTLGSILRPINHPVTRNKVNINKFLNMVIAASFSPYGNFVPLPKVEGVIEESLPLSLYAITKYVSELSANIFTKINRLFSNILSK